MRSRGLASPDDADALCLTFAPAGMSLQLGIGNQLGSRQPVRRSIRGME